MNSTPVLKQLREIQEGHQTYYSRKEYEEYDGIETVVMSKGMWDVMNLKLTEGKNHQNMILWEMIPLYI